MSGVSLPSLRGALAAAALAAAALLFALLFAVASMDQPLVALAVPGVLLLAVFCARFPAFSVFAVMLLGGAYGSLEAFWGFPAAGVVDALLAGLWVSVLMRYALGTRERPFWIWPGMALTLLYIVLTFFEIFTAIGASLGALSFKYSCWYMLCVPLLAFAGWRLETYVRIGKGILLVGLAVGAYAAYRLVVGPSDREALLAFTSAGSFNTIDGELSLIGSFPNRHELAFWAAQVVPFALAAMLMRGYAFPWRIAAGAVVALGCAAAFGTDVRAALPALIAGSGVVIALNLIAGRGRGTALAQTVTVTVLALTAGGVLFTVVAGESASRYSALADPEGDTSYEQHLSKWRAALEEMEGHPFGLGLATAGRVQESGTSPYLTVGSYAIDSTYLKIAFEQGFPVLILFGAAMIALFVGLARRAIQARAGPAQGIAIGATGAMAAGLSMFVTGQYIESLGVLVMWVSVGAAIGALGADAEVAQREAREAAD